MGTSTSNPGQKGRTPIVPSWLDDGNLEPLPGEPNRFTAPRSNFTRHLNDHRAGNGGRSGYLHRATSHYVRNSLGGSKNATLRLGAARSSTVRMFSVFNSIIANGISETQKQFNLGDILGKNASEALIMVSKFVCPDGGSTDEGIARDSYFEAIISMPELESKNIEELSPAEFLAFTEHYMSKVIEVRLLNDIGNKCFSLPDSVAQVDEIQRQLTAFIRGSISDAVARLNVNIAQISSAQAQEMVDSIYELSYDILASLGDGNL